MYALLFTKQDTYLGLVHHDEKQGWSSQLTPEGHQSIGEEMRVWKEHDERIFVAWCVEHSIRPIFVADKAHRPLKKILESSLKMNEKQALFELLGRTPEVLVEDWEQVLQ